MSHNNGKIFKCQGLQNAALARSHAHQFIYVYVCSLHGGRDKDCDGVPGACKGQRVYYQASQKQFADPCSKPMAGVWNSGWSV